jgi:hypothetical protein
MLLLGSDIDAIQDHQNKVSRLWQAPLLQYIVV